MTRHLHIKRNTKKIFFVILFLAAGALVVAYVYMLSESKGNNAGVVATSTPVVDKVPDLVTGPTISIAPSEVRQGEPALITIRGLTSTSTVKSFTFDKRPLVIFLHEGNVTALLGVDLHAVSGTFPLVLTFKDGGQIREDFVVHPREVIKEPFEIPDKLGGNTPEGEKQLISTLGQEAKIVNAIPTSTEKLWTEKFGSPLHDPLVVTSIYGYTRLTGRSTLSHKGTDFHADIGTSVYSMNRGLVRFAGNLRNYGNAVIIDHGLGLHTVYMHLSTINTTLNKMVEKGELIGMSGDTGYVLGPHLHLSVRVWDISIDPMKFLEVLGEMN